MSDDFAARGDTRADASHELSVDVLHQAIAHVDQLLERLDREPPNPADAARDAEHAGRPGPDKDGFPAVQLAAAIDQLSGPAGTKALAVAHAVRLILDARAAAERMRTQAYRASIDAAAKGQRLVNDAARAAAALQADAERAWADCDASAREQFRAADEAIRALLETSDPKPDEARADISDPAPAAGDGEPSGSGPEADVENTVDAAVREMEALGIDRRRRRRLADSR